MEAEVLERVAKGDFAAFEALYDRYHLLVYGIARRMLDDDALAEDVVQDVFTKLWTNPKSFRGGHFAGWLSRVTRNRTVDLLRQLRPAAELPNASESPESLVDEVIAKVDGERLRSALNELPEEQRSLIILGFFGGMVHTELARHTGVPLGTVKTRVRSGLKKLRAALEGYVVA